MPVLLSFILPSKARRTRQPGEACLHDIKHEGLDRELREIASRMGCEIVTQSGCSVTRWRPCWSADITLPAWSTTSTAIAKIDIARM